METNVILLVALVCALISGTVIAYAVCNAIRETLRTQKVQSRSGVDGSFISSILRHGIGAFRSLSPLLITFSPIRLYVEKFEQAVLYTGNSTTKEALLSLMIAATLVALLLGTIVSTSIACGLALSICVWLVIGLWSNHQYDTQRERLREAIPETLQSMKACFQVGYTLAQTIHEVRQSTTGPLGEIFKEVEGVLETGGSTEDALNTLKKKASEPELIFLAAALDIQHKTGSSMQQVLEITRQSVTDETELKRTLKTQTAQAKLSAQIVTIMPFALIGVFSLVSPGFLDPFFESSLGIILLICALAMQVIGISIVRKLLKVEVM